MGSDYLPHRLRSDRPWGSFEQFTQNQLSTVKMLRIAAGQEFSLQTHEHRDEFWRVLEGSGTVTVDGEHHAAAQGQEFWIPRGTEHRAQGGTEDLILLEIAFGQFDENDIARLADDYGRA